MNGRAEACTTFPSIIEKPILNTNSGAKYLKNRENKSDPDAGTKHNQTNSERRVVMTRSC